MIKLIAKHVDGLPIERDEFTQSFIDEDYVVIQHVKLIFLKFNVLNTYKIKIENIIDTIVASKKEIEEVNKSVIGRGLVGGLVFGPIGAVLGGMSGINKTKIQNKLYFVISYNSTECEVKNISIDVNTGTEYGEAKKLSKEINKRKPKKDNQPKVLEL